MGNIGFSFFIYHMSVPGKRTHRKEDIKERTPLFGQRERPRGSGVFLVYHIKKKGEDFAGP